MSIEVLDFCLLNLSQLLYFKSDRMGVEVLHFCLLNLSQLLYFKLDRMSMKVLHFCLLNLSQSVFFFCFKSLDRVSLRITERYRFT